MYIGGLVTSSIIFIIYIFYKLKKQRIMNSINKTGFENSIQITVEIFFKLVCV